MTQACVLLLLFNRCRAFRRAQSYVFVRIRTYLADVADVAESLSKPRAGQNRVPVKCWSKPRAGQNGMLVKTFVRIVRIWLYLLMFVCIRMYVYVFVCICMYL